MMMPKLVRFGETSKRCVPSLGLTRAERKALWFSKSEVKAFRQEASLEESNNNSGYYGSHQQEQRRRYISYVLQMQAANRHNGMEDSTGLAALAVAHSKSAVEKARFRAVKGAADVQKTHDATATTITRQAQQQQQHVPEEDTDDLKPTRCQSRRTRVAINAPRRNRTAANMA
ncbi:expressed unknown protein [Seminavis robusta]|uniref:Uncharacterized protein n=1 Tax=Seminavis robusta TaxID=568900 RepID=A0A9N8EK80_9STRA|nr:expressed unknown protein [Seminavis robusta]|eukprot:Sro1344_g264720.1 n/a (173) ;mRNA; f:22126-22644